MTDTIDPDRVDGYEFSDAKLSARESGVFSFDATLDPVDESDVGESFEFRRLNRKDDNLKFDNLCFITEESYSTKILKSN
jgi:hypothetical protein